MSDAYETTVTVAYVNARNGNRPPSIKGVDGTYFTISDASIAAGMWTVGGQYAVTYTVRDSNGRQYFNIATVNGVAMPKDAYRGGGQTPGQMPGQMPPPSPQVAVPAPVAAPVVAPQVAPQVAPPPQVAAPVVAPVAPAAGGEAKHGAKLMAVAQVYAACIVHYQEPVPAFWEAWKFVEGVANGSISGALAEVRRQPDSPPPAGVPGATGPVSHAEAQALNEEIPF